MWLAALQTHILLGHIKRNKQGCLIVFCTPFRYLKQRGVRLIPGSGAADTRLCVTCTFLTVSGQILCCVWQAILVPRVYNESEAWTNASPLPPASISPE